MGTVFQVKVMHPNPQLAAEAAEAALAEIRSQDQLLSDYLPDSELNQALAQAWPGPVVITQELYDALKQALDFAQFTQGAFDISVGPLLSLWGFRGGPMYVPTDSEIEKTRQQVGYQKIGLLNHPPRLQLKTQGMKLDFGGIGKGRALDRAATELRKRGISVASLSCDSSSYFLGSPAHSPRGWPVAVRHPRDRDHVLNTFWLKDQGLSTSGDDQQYFEQAGVRFSHILDPRTGRPAIYLGSMTVVAETAAQADALSTALLVLPIEQARALTAQQGIRALRIWEDKQHWHQDWLP
ncbi:MAG: FAD:protein FMN transferase [Candidatus Sericytochromatia bacterium]|nr:FAD:protein FMN transferase [Candidatus Sericytochromatia bacterium]